jgi:two-component system, response regulator YesN
MYKLLIVDDEWAHRHTLKKLLVDFELDFKVEKEAEDGKEALQFFLSHSFDAVFTDIKMPAIDGLSLLKHIHTKDSSIPVILVSTHSDFEYAKQGIQHGAFDYLVKPLDKEKLHSLLEKLRVFLSHKSNSKQHQVHVEKILSEKLDFGIREEYEDAIYTLLLNDAKELDSYLDELLTKHFAAYGYDHFKLGIAFENLISKIEEKLLTTFIFAQKIFNAGNYANDYFYSSHDEVSTIEKIKKEFLRISEFVQKLHLDQSDGIVKKLCEYALKESEKKPTLDEAAVLLNYNKDYLGKHFKSKTGESFSQFSAKIKLEHAKNLLQSNAYKHYEISEMLGYKDVGYFSKLFKEYTGLTPSEYKKRFKLEG